MLKLAKLYLWEQNYPLALANYRRAARIEELLYARKQGKADDPESGDRKNIFSGLAIASWHIASNAKLRASLNEAGDALMEEGFFAAQKALRTSAGAALAQMSARFAAGSGRLAKNIGRAQALRQSMLALINKTSDPFASHPSYWAPFVVVGEGAVK